MINWQVFLADSVAIANRHYYECHYQYFAYRARKSIINKCIINSIENAVSYLKPDMSFLKYRTNQRQCDCKKSASNYLKPLMNETKKARVLMGFIFPFFRNSAHRRSKNDPCRLVKL
jgi:hypothetical protein